ncbi:integrin alpha [Flindersiella endophytica]
MHTKRAAALLTAAGLAVAGLAAAAPVQAAKALPLVAIGVPDADVGSQADAGSVEIRNQAGVVQRLTAPSAKAGDRFGAVTTSGDLTGDGRPELIVGAPGRDIGGLQDSGAAFIYRGTATGYQYWRILGQGYSGIPGRAQAGAAFGASLSFQSPYRLETGEYTFDGSRLYVGAPFTDIGSATDAGTVVELDIPHGTTPAITGRVLTESSHPEWGTPASGERFGQAVAAGTELSIGAPGETVNGQAGAGAVFHRRWGGDEFTNMVITQDLVVGQEDVPGAAEAGDEFGRSLLDFSGHLWIGAPGEDIGTQVNAGFVNHFIHGMLNELDPAEGLTQGSYDPVARRPVGDQAEAGDRFGASMTGYWHDIVNHPWVYVGAPGEDIGGAVDAGMVNSLYSRGNQDVPVFTDATLGGTNERGDKFGSAVSSVLLSTDQSPITYGLVIGIPGENGYGVVKVASPFRVTWRLASPKAGDGYGSAVRVS